MYRTILLASLLAGAQLANAQAPAQETPQAQAKAQATLWQDLSAGMTEEEVRRAMPAVQPVRVPTIKMTTGAESKLQVPGQQLEGKTFEATMFFIAGKLSDVQLLHVAPVDAVKGRAAYNELLLALRAKHGQEQRTSNTRSFSEAAWAADGKVVTLRGAFEGNSTVLNLTFSGRPNR